MSRIILYSKIVLALKLNKIQLINAMRLSSKIDARLATREYYKPMIDEIEMRQREINDQIKKLMQPLFQGLNFGYIEWGQWALSQSEMEKGYARLQLQRNNWSETGNRRPNYYILFLSDYSDRGHTFKEGSLHLENDDITPILANQKNVFGSYINIKKHLKNQLILMI